MTNPSAAPAAKEFHPTMGYHAEFPLAMIMANKNQPRKKFDPTKQDEMTASVKAKGVIQPIVLRTLSGIDFTQPSEKMAETQLLWDKGIRAEIVAGERRFRSSIAAGLATIPAIMRDLRDEEVLEIQLIENDQREDVHELEEALAYKRLLEFKRAKKEKFNADDIAKKIGKSRTYVFNRLKLADLCDEAQTAFLDDAIDFSRAELIARISVPKTQQAALKVAAERDDTGDYKLSLRGLRALLLQEFSTSLASAPFDIKVADYANHHGAVIAGPCGPCPHRSGNCAESFPDIKSADVCTEVECFRKKKFAARERLLAEIKASGADFVAGTLALAKQIFPTSSDDTLHHNYAAPDTKVFGQVDAKKRGQTYEQMLGKELPAVWVENPHTTNLIRLVIVEAANAMLIDKKIMPKPEQPKPEPRSAAGATGKGDQSSRSAPVISPLIKPMESAPSSTAFVLDQATIIGRAREKAYRVTRAYMADGLPPQAWQLLAKAMLRELEGYCDPASIPFLASLYPQLEKQFPDKTPFHALMYFIEDAPYNALPRLLMDITFADSLTCGVSQSHLGPLEAIMELFGESPTKYIEAVQPSPPAAATAAADTKAKAKTKPAPKIPAAPTKKPVAIPAAKKTKPLPKVVKPVIEPLYKGTKKPTAAKK